MVQLLQLLALIALQMCLVSADQSYICADHTEYIKSHVPSGGSDTCEETINAYVETSDTCSGSGCTAGTLAGKDFTVWK